MPDIGILALGIAFTACMIVVVCGVAAWLLQRKDDPRSQRAWRASIVSFFVLVFSLSLAIFILAWCFLVEDMSLIYVASNHPISDSRHFWLVRLSALWSGKSGSLLLWAWLVSLWSAPQAIRAYRSQIQTANTKTGSGGYPFDGKASFFATSVSVSCVVLLGLLGMLLFSFDNMPFWPTPGELLDESGHLIEAASGMGMNSVLDHWAMNIHPLLLFIGYAGFTIPFSLTVAMLLEDIDLGLWRRCTLRSMLIAWGSMTSAIVLGAVWAGSTPGWSGYWSWDAVETASLIPWIAGITTVAALLLGRRRRKALRFAGLLSALTFTGTMICAFVTRSGFVRTIHGYAGDSASASVLAIMAVASIVAAIWIFFAFPAVGKGKTV